MSISQNYPNVAPQLLIDLANTQKLDPRLTFARASVGTYYDENGVLQTASSGVARLQFDPVTGVSQGLLRENQATNLVTYSEDFSNAAWTKTNGSLESNVVIAPDGTLTGDKLVENTAGVAHDVRRTLSFTAGTYSFSIYAKYAGRVLRLQLQSNNNSEYAVADFDLQVGTSSVSYTSPSGVSGVFAKIEEVGNGFFRCSVIATYANALSIVVIRTVPSVAFGLSGIYTGDGVSGIYIWGAQLEAGSFPTSYIKTEASQVTRAADTVTLTNTGAYNTAEFTAVSSPFGVSGVSANTVTLNGDVPIERLYVYPRNISQNEINSIVENDGWWNWRIVGSDFALPNFTTDGTVIVDWGDGTVETLTTAVHTFTNASPHTVRFRMGSGTEFKPRIANNVTHDLKVIAVGSAPSNMIVNCDDGFFGCSNLKSFDATLRTASDVSLGWNACSSLASFPFIDTSAGTTFASAWTGCSSLTSFPLIDTSSGTSFSGAWQNCTSLTSLPAIDTSSGTNFSDTWNNCNKLTSFPLLDMSSATTVNECWDACTSLTSFPAIDFPVCTNFTEAWRSCSSLTSFPLVDTSAGTLFNNTWNGCSSLTSFPLIDTSSGTNFSLTWFGCSSLTSFPLIDTSAGTTFFQTWTNCTSLTSFPLIDTSAGTDFFQTWENCPNLTSFPLINTSLGTRFERTWRACAGLTAFPLININNSTSFSLCWNGCTALTDFPANMFDSWTGVPVANCFLNTWLATNALTTTSVENILVSIDTSGVSAPATGTEITISYNVATGALTAPTTSAITSLKGKNWTIKINGVLQ
jgi:hypothetical protein